MFVDCEVGICSWVFNDYLLVYIEPNVEYYKHVLGMNYEMLFF